MTVPIKQQRLERDLADIKLDLQQGRHVSGEQWLRVIERRLGTLPADIRDSFPAFSSPAKSRRGRIPNDRGVEDFGMREVDRLYSALLKKFQSEGKSPSGPGHAAPSERAYRFLAKKFSELFGVIDWLAMRNKHSAWRNGHSHPADKITDSDDFDAEIERQFPAHQK